MHEQWVTITGRKRKAEEEGLGEARNQRENSLATTRPPTRTHPCKFPTREHLKTIFNSYANQGSDDEIITRMEMDKDALQPEPGLCYSVEYIKSP